MLSTIFLIIAIICFVLAGINVKIGTVAIGWFGLAFLAASFLV